MRATAAAGPAIIRAEITVHPACPVMLMGPITVMWAPTINLTSRNITGPTLTLVTGRTLTRTMGRILTLVTGRMLTRAAGTFAGIIAGVSAGCLAANTVAIIAADSVLVDRQRDASFLGEMKGASAMLTHGKRQES